MADPTTVLEKLREHFQHLTSDDYVAEARRHSPEILEGGPIMEDPELAQLGLPGLETQEATTVIALRPPRERPLLSAYLACALTGLNEEQRQLVFNLSDTVKTICEGLGIVLYEPRMMNDPVHHPEVPDTEVFHSDRERVISSDLVIFLGHYPSTGSGEELAFAYNALVPIVVVHHATSQVSRMVTGIPGMVVTVAYKEPEEFRARLEATLLQLRPKLVQRKLAFGDYDANIVGARIRRLREAQGLTREDVARASSERFPIKVDLLARIEESTDKDSNPSLIHLREIATALRTTVADLVEPDLEALSIATLNDWVAQRQAARFGDVSTRDRNRILRRLLLRIIDSLEDD